MSSHQRLHLAIVAALSGLAIFLVYPFMLFFGSDVQTFYMLFAAGVPYGLATGLFLEKKYYLHMQYGRLIKWIIASSLSYLAATWVMFFVPFTDNTNLIPEPSYASFAIAGIIGALVLILAWHVLYTKLAFSYSAGIVVVAAILGAILSQITVVSDIVFYEGYLELYIIWQGVITYLLARTLKKKDLPNTT